MRMAWVGGDRWKEFLRIPVAHEPMFKEQRGQNDEYSTFGPLRSFRAMQCSYRAMRHVEAICVQMSHGEKLERL